MQDHHHNSNGLPPERDLPSCAPSFHEQLLNNLYDGVYFVDGNRQITFWNQGAECLTGYSRNEAVGRYCYDNFLKHVDENGVSLCLTRCPLAKTIEDGQRRECQVFLQHAQGHRVPVSVRVAPIRDAGGQIIGAVEIFTDVTDQMKVARRAAKFEKLAFQDILTGINNRRFIDLKVRQAILEVAEFKRQFGLLAIDVDHFKKINDIHGHEVGDQVLRSISRLLLSGIRPGDFVGRWGGEEFLALIADVDEEALLDVADRIRRLLSLTPLQHQVTTLTVTVSIGATLLRGEETLEDAVKRADVLMYKSKAKGRNCSTTG